jgi:hypothetical protein
VKVLESLDRILDPSESENIYNPQHGADVIIVMTNTASSPLLAVEITTEKPWLKLNVNYSDINRYNERIASSTVGHEMMIMDIHPIWVEFDAKEEVLFGDWALGPVKNTLYIPK